MIEGRRNRTKTNLVVEGMINRDVEPSHLIEAMHVGLKDGTVS
jgi:hypothetical protein